MMRRVSDTRGECRQPDRRIGIAEQAERVGDRNPVATDLVGLAAQAGSEPGIARGGGIGVLGLQ
jgi:hypothetical protein